MHSNTLGAIHKHSRILSADMKLGIVAVWLCHCKLNLIMACGSNPPHFVEVVTLCVTSPETRASHVAKAHAIQWEVAFKCIFSTTHISWACHLLEALLGPEIPMCAYAPPNTTSCSLCSWHRQRGHGASSPASVRLPALLIFFGACLEAATTQPVQSVAETETLTSKKAPYLQVISCNTITYCTSWRMGW